MPYVEKTGCSYRQQVRLDLSAEPLQPQGNEIKQSPGLAEPRFDVSTDRFPGITSDCTHVLSYRLEMDTVRRSAMDVFLLLDHGRSVADARYSGLREELQENVADIPPALSFLSRDVLILQEGLLRKRTEKGSPV